MSEEIESLLKRAAQLAGAIPRFNVRSRVAHHIAAAINALNQPTASPDFGELSRAASSPSPASAAAGAITAVMRDHWPSSARALSALAIEGDKGLGDIAERKLIDPLDIQTWKAAIVELVDCQTCRGNWRGVLNQRYPL